jgi:hypothetical protein
MKLNPEDLDVMSFETGADVAQASVVVGGGDAAVVGPYRPLDPTPNSRCFVCEYT